MSGTTKRAPLSERLQAGLREGIAFALGEQDLVGRVLPLELTYTPEDMVAIRSKRQLSQLQFAKLLGVNVKTLQNWEQGVRVPNRPTMRRMQNIDEPESFRPIRKTGVVRTDRNKSR